MAAKAPSQVARKFTSIRLILAPRTCGPVSAIKDEFLPLPGGKRWDWYHLPITTIPVTDSTCYQDTLSRIARGLKPFQIALGRPSLVYRTVPRKSYFVTLLSESVELRRIQNELKDSLHEVVKREAEAFTDNIRSMPEFQTQGRKFVRPRVEIDSSVAVFRTRSEEEARRVLENIAAMHGEHICTVTAVGIQLYQRAGDLSANFRFQ
ncbi:hypothetical protein PZA11_005922 [Diplocarpon coronariae]|uniref:Uncharacterized protein n=1 Tax=Diplocarpon coronariae TaxID=2795749 RepID=A0A218Z1N6_9HELO|nr:hypothetical protein JHW43_005171 [Diplocarpon mali]OWP01594.1 hypothetical protein B2J93_2110 [Marssonina coronariae]